MTRPGESENMSLPLVTSGDGTRGESSQQRHVGSTFMHQSLTKQENINLPHLRLCILHSDGPLGLKSTDKSNDCTSHRLRLVSCRRVTGMGTTNKVYSSNRHMEGSLASLLTWLSCSRAVDSHPAFHPGSNGASHKSHTCLTPTTTLWSRHWKNKTGFVTCSMRASEAEWSISYFFYFFFFSPARLLLYCHCLHPYTARDHMRTY